ncbi:MAG: hypothetical protein NC124_18780 [Clostridium sp.]|nr:hypothetical protein [Clostridium sp.]
MEEKSKKGKNLIIEFLHNPTFRDRVFMTVSAILNLLYASAKLAIAVFEKSFWFGAIAVYFLCLWEIRSLIVWVLERKPFDRKRECQFSVFCGIWFLVLNMVLSGITLQVIWFGRCYEYPRHLIILVGVYTFYAIPASFWNQFRYRKEKKPLMAIAKLYSFASACVSLLFLQTALLATYGENFTYTRLLNTFSACSTCLLFSLIGSAIIIQSTRYYKKDLKADN